MLCDYVTRGYGDYPPLTIAASVVGFMMTCVSPSVAFVAFVDSIYESHHPPSSVFYLSLKSIGERALWTSG